ncbi:hypothetical protein K493DRAFT_38820 [Basidiobolus meristosporus CBS 931.73]|uniref:RING-type domain-containing protein n=1 Tax=Basidiobolus meristosporus CBS 931.73 TaxID=1314790 RepID=A0A1Y1Y590_9FUNG|nr:hypothetical protein K493DRAFT_38820 [Basidiobolus meristosporus CBS 931.73]|eukprot:ORX93055.1 hypothetical protein K493DRAFT_38820 [Basidiobolus meristosporus CBS 931.73]
MSERIFIKLPLSAFKNLPEESQTNVEQNAADPAESSTPPKRRRGRPAGKRSSPMTPVSISPTGKREAAVAAREKLSNSNKKTKESKSRKSRSRNTSRSPGGTSKNSSNSSGERSQRCFICEAVLSGDIHEITQHIDQCLTTHELGNESQDATTPSSVSSTQFVEYEWAGQSRVRATSLLEAGFAGTGFLPCRKEQDVEDDLDIDQVEAEVYGQAQFSDRDILILKDRNDDEGLQYENDTLQTEASQDLQPVRTYLPAPSHVDSGTNDNATQLLIESLKAQVQEQKALSEAVQRCVICLDPYRSPLVSVSCWHVHCEKCWLHTLGAKKLCPQCQCITQPTDLRRIYL